MSNNNMLKSKDNNKKSLCEESLLVFVNILKLSSIALARKALSSKSYNDDHHTSISITNFNCDDHASPCLSPAPQHQRKSKPKQATESKISYVLMLQDDNDSNNDSNNDHDNGDGDGDGQFAEYIRRFHMKTENEVQNGIVEGKAVDYIKKFHEKNINDLNNDSLRRFHYVLPPPPQNVFK